MEKYNERDYHQRLDRLVAQVRWLNEDPWSTTPVRKDAEAIADDLDGVVRNLRANGDAQWLIGSEHDRAPDETGLDGWPEPLESFDVRYDEVVYHMERLAASARRAIAPLPNSRVRRALPFAALGVLLLRHTYEMPPAVLSNHSDDVVELEFVCDAAGMHQKIETLRNALSEALKVFDPQFVPSEYRHIVYGRLT